MKNFRHYIAYLAVFAVMFTSCSKEEAGTANSDSEMATLTLGAIVNDLAAQAVTRQAENGIPECSGDDPAYVKIVLMKGDDEVVGTSEVPHRVNLAANELFTVEDPALELVPGDYTLDHFAVYNSDNEVIWIAPRRGSTLGEYVANALPLAIDLRAGVKKYVDVSVLCFDNREVNQYGYLFYELDTNVALEYCFFANYCDTDGRHFPARYSVSVWAGTNNQGTALYTNVENHTGEHDNGDLYASPLCLALPDNDDMNTPYLYYEITLLDWNDADAYGDVTQVVKSGTLTKKNITDNFADNGEVDFEHFRFGCGDDDGDNGETPVDSDGDNIPDAQDNCPNEAGPASNNGCPEEPVDGDEDNDGVVDSIDECENTPAGTTVNSVGCPVATCDPTNPNADCDNDGTLNKCDRDNANWSGFNCDGDAFLNGVDTCPLVASSTNNGCPEVPVESCLDATPEGCDTLSATYNVTTGSFTITESSIGDVTYEITEDGLFVGITPVVPYEIQGMEVTVGSVVTCAADEDVSPADGAFVVIPGITVADLPLEIGIKVNYCNISE